MDHMYNSETDHLMDESEHLIEDFYSEEERADEQDRERFHEIQDSYRD